MSPPSPYYLIIGAGPVGLYASASLADYGINCHVVEKYAIDYHTREQEIWPRPELLPSVDDWAPILRTESFHDGQSFAAHLISGGSVTIKRMQEHLLKVILNHFMADSPHSAHGRGLITYKDRCTVHLEHFSSAAKLREITGPHAHLPEGIIFANGAASTFRKPLFFDPTDRGSNEGYRHKETLRYNVVVKYHTTKPHEQSLPDDVVYRLLHQTNGFFQGLLQETRPSGDGRGITTLHFLTDRSGVMLQKAHQATHSVEAGDFRTPHMKQARFKTPQTLRSFQRSSDRMDKEIFDYVKPFIDERIRLHGEVLCHGDNQNLAGVNEDMALLTIFPLNAECISTSASKLGNMMIGKGANFGPPIEEAVKQLRIFAIGDFAIALPYRVNLSVALRCTTKLVNALREEWSKKQNTTTASSGLWTSRKPALELHLLARHQFDLQTGHLGIVSKFDRAITEVYVRTGKLIHDKKPFNVEAMRRQICTELRLQSLSIEAFRSFATSSSLLAERDTDFEQE